ncbi:MAG: ribbon-helix-helix protein, CopG family [Bacteroidales bacterium]|nr:ribbon-helix-helix protein, CopG family [Candidatus Colicola caccequi]MCQ2328453.1 ribbon-helix-helix domain-containing protein [Paludibacteraceae bacterium]
MRKAPRNNKVTIMLNDAEVRALDRYCEQFHVTNRSKLIREAVIRTILKKMDENSPTLF